MAENKNKGYQKDWPDHILGETSTGENLELKRKLFKWSGCQSWN
jgi:hypothetical protein